MDKRVFITVLVCVGIMLVWQNFVMPPPKKVAKSAQQQAASAVATNALEPASMAASSQPMAQPVIEEKSVELQTPDYTARLSTVGAAISSFTLSGYKEARAKSEDKKPVNLVERPGLPAVSFEVNDRPLVFASVEQKNTQVVFTGEQGGIKTTAIYTVDKDYQLHFSAQFDNTTANAVQIKPALAVRGIFNDKAIKDKSFLSPAPDLLTPLLEVNDKVYRHTRGKKDTPELTKQTRWAGVDRQFFVIAAAPKEGAASAEFTENPIGPDATELGATLHHDVLTLAPGQATTIEYTLYVGPKVAKLLKEANAGFEAAVDYSVWGLPLGFLSRPMLWILKQAQERVGSYGWAIVILTLIVKLIMWPITMKSFASMQVMKELKPELDKIKDRFPNDREKQGMETMRLYKERNVNPFLGGCLPALLQMPVFFALYRTLYAAVELYQQEFLWFKDLTAPDPLFIMPVLLGATMFVQQKMAPPAGDPQQQKIMMYMMPPLMTSFMLFLPSGLVFYYFVNNVLTMLQQTYITKKFTKKPVPTAA